MRPETTRRKALEEEAANWLAKLDAGTAAPDSFEAWRSADPAHAAAFLRVAAIWTTLDQAKLHASFEEPVSVAIPEAAMASASRHGRRAVLRAGMAAGVTILAGSGLFLATRGFAKSASTEIGERRIVRLEDGGSVELNTQSAISWQVSRTRRRIRLEQGEIALTVPAAGSAACRLEAGGCLADLSPGRYGARLAGDMLYIFVVEGLALVRRIDAARQVPVVRLSAAESAAFGAKDIRQSRLSAEDMASLSAWQRGEIILQGQTLEQAVADYNRYLTKKIVLADPRLRQLRLGGRFLTSEPDAFLRALTSQFGARVRADDGNLLVTL